MKQTIILFTIFLFGHALQLNARCGAINNQSTKTILDLGEHARYTGRDRTNEPAVRKLDAGLAKLGLSSNKTYTGYTHADGTGERGNFFIGQRSDLSAMELTIKINQKYEIFALYVSADPCVELSSVDVKFGRAEDGTLTLTQYLNYPIAYVRNEMDGAKAKMRGKRAITISPVNSRQVWVHGTDISLFVNR